MTKTIRKAALYIAALAVLLAAVLVAVPWEAGAEEVGAFLITGGTLGEDYEFDDTNGVLTVLTSEPLTISNMDKNTSTDNTIVVAAGVDADITLDGVNIDVSSKSSACAFKIEDDSTGNVTITLEGENVLKSGSVCAGLQKNGTGENIGTLIIKGTGSLEAVGGECGAGIGGSDEKGSSNIEISGGTVTATGGYDGAGIGGGYRGSGSDITISDGTVAAKGGEKGAGIGGGYSGGGTNITVSGGTITAASDYNGAGIGGGAYGGCSEIIISGGSVRAVRYGNNPDAIGGSERNWSAVTPTSDGSTPVYLFTIANENGEAVRIDDADADFEPVNHNAADSADNNLYLYLTGEKHTIKVGKAEIECYFDADNNEFYTLGTNFTITGDDLVYGEDYTYLSNTGVLTVLSGKKMTIANADPNTAVTDTIVVAKNVSADITLDGVNIDVSATPDVCAFKIEDDSEKDVTITLADGSTNVLKSGKKCAGLQKNGSVENIGKLTIEGTGSLEAVGGYEGAGIGGGTKGSASNIEISGGTVTAGGYDAAGIGGGYEGSGSNITISGGTVIATGGSSSAGIGGSISDGSNIEISGGNVTAKGGSSGAGIGGGTKGSGSNITISGGTVIAKGGYYGAGIGGGDTNRESADIGGKNITISGGTVTAEGGYNAAGIGGGAGMNGGTCENVIISGGSVKAVAGEGGNDIGGGHYRAAVTPTSDGSTPVYPLTIANANGEAVKIDDADFEPANHNAADSADYNLYLYLTGKKHTIKVGKAEIECYFDADNNELWAMGTNFIVEGGTPGTDYIYRDGVLTVKTDTALTVKNADGVATTIDTIAVAENASVNITLAGVNIDVSKIDDACAFFIEDDSTGNVNITLADGSTNVLKSSEDYAGIHKEGSGEDIGKLTIGGTGSLEAVGGYRGAGIGGGYNGAGSNITISGGKVTATGGKYAAGIGGGYNGAGSNITISGGVVTAAGGDDGAGIGGGYEGIGSNITISGGTVTATGSGEYVADIGGSYSYGDNIIISGGSVKAAVITEGNEYQREVIPTDGNGEYVYPIVIANPDGKKVLINGKAYTPVNHKAADPNDGNMYAYVPSAGEYLTVTVGDTEIKYYFDHDAKLFWTMGSDFIITGGNPSEDYIYPADTGVLTVKTSKAITIANADGVAATTDTIAVVKDVAANITLNGVNIDVSKSKNACAFKIEDNSTENVTITLKEGSTNVLKSGENCAGLQKNGSDESIGKLTIKGAGSLEAVGGEYGAGIGGGYDGRGANITVSDSTVTATGGYGGAGIGGGYAERYGSGSDITISGSVVTATGGNYGAGIGGGSDGSSSNIKISGSTVTAIGGGYAADIGGGYRGSGLGITISGGSVKAGAGGNNGTIGGGDGQAAVTPKNSDGKKVYPLVIANPDGKEVLIDGNAYTPVNHNAADPKDGNLYVYVEEKATYTVTVGGVESTYYFDSEKNMFWTMGTELTVTGGAHLTDYIYRDGVLTVKTNTALTIENTDKTKTTMDTIVVAAGVNANITLNGVNIDAEFDDTCAFLIEDDSTGNVTITLAEGSTNVLESGYYCAGIQKNGSGENIGKLTIEGTGTLEVYGGNRGAGIGSGIRSIASNITINGGNITAKGGACGAGIGGGLASNGEKITVTGGVITANGGENSAGIGGGDCGSGTNITISGGKVTANGCSYGGAGIGGGDEGNGSDITISGGTVIATGANEAAGIGGGKKGGSGGADGTNITISGGTVTAIGKYRGAGIGGGNYGIGENIIISGGSVKAVEGEGASAIGCGAHSSGAVTPTDGKGNNVYLLTVVNPDDKEVTIGGKPYTPANHKAADPKDGNLYAYVPSDSADVIVTLDGTPKTYYLDNDTNEFWTAGTNFTVTGGTPNVDYTYYGGVLTVKTDKAMTIANADGVDTTTDTIAVAAGVSADITLNGVNIDVSEIEEASAFKIADDSTGNVTITLAENSLNVLKSGNYCAGIQKNGSGDGIGTLTINGAGSLEAVGGNYAAGIGGGFSGSGSNINISGGTVTATSGYNGAGIGGGYGGSGSNINISGGTVTANGGDYGAGIGGGYDSGCENITVSGGSVKAVAGWNASVIGGGADSSGAVTPTDGSGNNVYLLTVANPDGKEVTIGGKPYTPVNHKAADPADGNLYVYVKGEDCSVTVGNTTTDYLFDSEKNEFWTMGTEFTVTGGKHLTDYIYRDGVLTVKTDAALTIANTDKTKAATDTIFVEAGTDANITLNGVNIDVSKIQDACAFKIADDSANSVTITLAGSSTNVLKSGENCAGIQKNSTGNSLGKLTINGTGSLEAYGGAYGAGIGGGRNGYGSNIEISGGTVTAKGGECGAGIGGGYCGGGSDITISGGTVTANGGNCGAGIGGGIGGGSSYITISGGTVIANGGNGGAGIGGGNGGAGIGGGDGGSGTNVTISGGTVTAAGGYYGAGIGGGNNGIGSDITISGGIVTATGVNYGAGIGGGYRGDGSNITISGGAVNANGGDMAAGIGGGYNGNGSYITISGGTVTAKGGVGSYGIGGGNSGDTSYFVITGGSVLGWLSVTPTNGTKDVYLLTIENPDGKKVFIDNKEYLPANHNAADSEDGNLYVYLTGEEHLVKVGDTEKQYMFDSEEKVFWIYGTDFTVTGGEHLKDYICRDGVLIVLKDTPLNVSNTDKTKATADTIAVAAGVNANITLDGVNIDVSEKSSKCALKIADDSMGSVTITLAENSLNVLKSGDNCAGIQKNGSGDGVGTLTIKGTGSLEAVGGYYSAGIGGGNGGSASNIIISGGVITANGGKDGGAGVGGGSYGSGSNITISGSTVSLKAVGGYEGAGIGGGYSGDGSHITISGGAVNANGGGMSAGIGGGYNGDGSHITISGGTVTAKGGVGSYGIGGGNSGSTSYFVITGGSVLGGSSVTPTNGTENVYLLTIENPDGKKVFLDNKEYFPANHKAVDPDNGDLYVYLPDGTHTVKIDEELVHYHLDSDYGEFFEAVSGGLVYDGESHWYSCRTDGCDFRFDEEAHHGGTATCSHLAICEVCGAEYGELDPDNHEEVSTELRYDGVSHWYECTSCHARVDEEAHHGGTATCSHLAICEECGVEYGELDPENHYEISTTWSYDGESHWHYCIGCHEKIDETAHHGGKATCSIGAICEECGAEYGELDPDNHEEISAEWKYDDDTHWHECTGCHEKFDEAAHSGTATCSSLAVCEECGVVHGDPDPDNHISISTAWNYDNNSHWHECIGCHKNFDITDHFGGEATCNTLAICEACGMGYGELDPHNHTDVSQRWDCDSESHWHECRNCGGKVDEAAHDGSPDCVTPGICSVCGERYSDVDPTNHTNHLTAVPAKAATCTEDGNKAYFKCDCGKLFTDRGATAETTLEAVTIKAAGHKWSEDHKFDEHGHWHYCTVCGETGAAEAHKSSGAATETTPETCTVCGYVITPELGHVHADHLTAVPAKAATCTEDGYTAHFKCSCGKLFADETAATEVTLADVTIKATGHSWSKECRSDETGHWHYCTVCGEAGVAEAHKSSGAATETTPETCTVCGYVITPELGHSHTDYLTEVPAKAATCTEDGNIAYFKCACGKLFTDSTATTETTLEAVTIKAEGHKFGRWITTKPATRTSTGIKTRTCTVCGETEEAVIPKRTSGGGGGGGYYFEPMPKINGEEKSWDEIISEIKKLPEGGTLVIDMNGTTSVPADAVKAISSSKIRVEFIIDSTKSYVTDGAKITNVSGADFTILAGVADRSGLRGAFGADIKIGDVGIPADMKLKLNKDAVGKFANIYRLTDGRLTFISCAKVDESSIATISGMDTKGEYVVMVCEFSDVRGDVNNDGVLNALDAASILRSVIGLEECKNPLMADFNSDGAVNALDAAAILKRIIGVA